MQARPEDSRAPTRRAGSRGARMVSVRLGWHAALSAAQWAEGTRAGSDGTAGKKGGGGGLPGRRRPDPDLDADLDSEDEAAGKRIWTPIRPSRPSRPNLPGPSCKSRVGLDMSGGTWGLCRYRAGYGPGPRWQSLTRKRPVLCRARPTRSGLERNDLPLI